MKDKTAYANNEGKRSAVNLSIGAEVVSFVNSSSESTGAVALHQPCNRSRASTTVTNCQRSSNRSRTKINRKLGSLNDETAVCLQVGADRRTSDINTVTSDRCTSRSSNRDRTTAFSDRDVAASSQCCQRVTSAVTNRQLTIGRRSSQTSTAVTNADCGAVPSTSADRANTGQA